MPNFKTEVNKNAINSSNMSLKLLFPYNFCNIGVSGWACLYSLVKEYKYCYYTSITVKTPYLVDVYVQ